MSVRLVSSIVFALAIALAPIGGTALAQSPGARMLVATTVTTLKVAGLPFAVAIDAAAGRGYVTDTTRNVLSVFDLASGAALAQIETGAEPGALVLGPNNRAYVANFRDASISVIDTAQRVVVKTVRAGGLGLALDTAQGRLYAASGPGGIAVIDTATDAVLRTIPAPAGASLWGLALDPAAHRLYATDLNAPRLHVIDTATDAVTGQIALGAPARLAITAGPNGRVYAATDREQGAVITVIDGASGEAVRTIAVGAFPAGLALDASSGVLYSTSRRSADVSAYDATTGASLGRAGSGESPAGLAVDPASGALYLATTGAPPAPPAPSSSPVVR